jgi:hypothetical protein
LCLLHGAWFEEKTNEFSCHIFFTLFFVLHDHLYRVFTEFISFFPLRCPVVLASFLMKLFILPIALHVPTRRQLIGGLLSNSLIVERISGMLARRPN